MKKVYLKIDESCEGTEVSIERIPVCFHGRKHSKEVGVHGTFRH